MSLTVPFWRLFTYSNRVDYLLMCIGAVCAMGMGVIQPLLFYLVGDIYRSMHPTSTPDEYYDKAVDITYQMLIYGSVYSVLSYGAVVAWIFVGSRQAHHFRREYLSAILRQDVAWFDQRNVAQLPSAVASDTLRIEKATGDKLVAVIFISVMLVTALLISLNESAQLTLLDLAFSPLMAGGMALTNRTMEKNAKAEDASYLVSGGIAEEALSEVKTVAAFNSQAHFVQRYCGSLVRSYRQMLRDGLTIGISTGLAIGSFLGMLGASVVTGATLIRNDDNNWIDGSSTNVGAVIIVVFVSMMAFHNVATLIPCIKLMAEGRVAASNVFSVIRQESSVVSGTERCTLQGAIQFQEVCFTYPGRSNPVLENASFALIAGDCLAIVGETGCGKSTVLSLLLRFYDPTQGRILVDGFDLKDLDLAVYRQQCGVVSQEPILFNDTIRNNLLYAKPDASEDELLTAIRVAEASDFVSEFAQGLNTPVGSRGSQLSGGEKQRLAIARAVLRNPRLLLLDEATSALDKHTESSVQQTLNSIMPGCTTIIVAHRISTIRRATKVLVLANGTVVETGTQEELMALQGRFYHMVKMQDIDTAGPAGKAASLISKGTRTTFETGETEGPAQQNPHFTRRFLKMTGKYWPLMVVGSFGAILVGVGYPCNGLLLGLEIQVLAQEQGDTLVDRSRFYGGFLGLCAVSVFCGLLLQALSFPLLSAKSTRELRQESFEALLSFDMEFFDSNNPSALASRLSSDCQKINGLGGSIFGLLAGMLCSLLTAYIISGIYCWQLALLILLTLPVQIFSTIATFLAQAQGLVSYSYEDATAFASDCIINYKTVKAFGAETALVNKYLEVTSRATRLIQRRSHIGGLSFGLGFGLLFYIYALIYWMGAYLFKEGTTSFKDMNVSIFAAITGTSSIFLSGIFAPDVKQGQAAAKNLFRLLDYKPKLSVNSQEGCREAVQGAIEFRDVVFAYPSRDLEVLSSVSFQVPKGSSLAVVGTTGSGKSTVLQLLLRYYDVKAGAVLVDGKNVKDFQVRTLRAAFSLVSQEPVLFSGSIKENIALGSSADFETVRQAALRAQAAAFIESTEEGYDREVGAKGARLSGGEKQRVAIARALVRNAPIILLDEATAALDSDTEQALLSSLRTALNGRTCIAIAHRVKTITNFDQIAVLSEGRLIEIGTYQQLYDQGGYFYSLLQQA
jgi:ATP-binding cassette subfamily B (MDR/TAP) protein 1